MGELTIVDLVRNGTLSAELAALFWSAVEEQMSFIVAAVPRLAGKSTTSAAIRRCARRTCRCTTWPASRR
jgi:Flp pilus assembly CpaF family ATPase